MKFTLSLSQHCDVAITIRQSGFQPLGITWATGFSNLICIQNCLKNLLKQTNGLQEFAFLTSSRHCWSRDQTQNHRLNLWSPLSQHYLQFTVEFNDVKQWLHLANALTACHMASHVGLLLLSIFKKFPSFKTCSMDDKLVFSWQLPSYLSPNSWPPSDPTGPTSYPAWTIFLSPIGNYIFRKGKRSLGSCLRDLHILQQEIKTGAHQLANYLVFVNKARAVQTLSKEYCMKRQPQFKDKVKDSQRYKH